MAGAKKGLSPLAWVAIGCGGLLLILGIVAVVGLGWIGGKVKDFAEEAEKNPALASAKAIAWANPDIEVVGSDEVAQTITFRNTKTEDEWTVSFEDVEAGRWTVSKNGEDVTFSATEADGVTVTRSGGDEAGTVRLGGTDTSGVPSWAPIYPDAEVQPGMRSSSGGKVQGMLNLEIQDEAESVVTWYQQTLEAAGFQVEITRIDSSNAAIPAMASLVAKNQDEGREVNVAVRGDGSPVTAMVQYNGAP